MRKLQTLFVVVVTLAVAVTSCKNGSKKQAPETETKKEEVVVPKANPNNGKEFKYEGYIVPNNLATLAEGHNAMCSLRETFEEKDPLSAKAIVNQVSLPFGKTPNSIYYKGKGDDYSKVEVYDKDGNKYDCYSTKFKITGKAVTIEGSDNFILEKVVITKL